MRKTINHQKEVIKQKQMLIEEKKQELVDLQVENKARLEELHA